MSKSLFKLANRCLNSKFHSIQTLSKFSTCSFLLNKKSKKEIKPEEKMDELSKTNPFFAKYAEKLKAQFK
jgi:hypothetical protein